MVKKTFIALILTVVILLSCTVGFAEADKTTVQFYFPVQLGGAAAELIEQFAAEFESANPDIEIDAVFCGNYNDTLTKLTLALEGGDAPQLVILANGHLLTLLSMDALVCLDDYIAADGGDELINDFYPAYMDSCIYSGSYYAMPFQRSVLAMYYNKDHFAAAGLDPEDPPKTWDELLEFGAKLTTRNEDGSIDHWGVMIANNSGWAQQSMCISASPDSGNIFSSDGTEVYFDSEAVRAALQYALDLQAAGASPEGIIDEGMMPSSFIEGAVSMIAVSSGNLTNINNNVEFDYGVCTMPAKATEMGASIAGGGNMFMIRSEGSTQEEYDAAWKFMRYMTEPETQARWSVGTGYIASRVSAKETETMQAYFENLPQAAVMYDQLSSTFRETTVFANAEVNELFVNMFESVVLGESSIDDAVAFAQSEADYILSDYR